MNQPVRIQFSSARGKMDEFYPGGMELMATSIQMDVERKFNPIPIPLSGGARFAIDMGSVNSAIQIEGVLTDDDPAVRAVAGSKAVAKIDTQFLSSSHATVGKLQAVGIVDYPSVDFMQIGPVDNVVWQLLFVTSAGALPTGNIAFADLSTPTRIAQICVHNVSSGTHISASQLATAIASAINDSTSGWEAPFTASVLTSELKPSVGATLVSIQYDAVGSAGNDISLSAVKSSDNSGSSLTLYHTTFNGGRNDSGGSGGFVRSAGDKLQDLYGIVHNTQKPGSALIAGSGAGIAAIAGLIGSGGTLSLVGGSALFAAPAAAGGITGIFVADGDYPSKLIIPYNSMLTADDGELYSVRHLRLAIGVDKTRTDKLSTSNTSTKDNDGEDIAISGGIKSLTLGHQAGESIYSFRMTYLPVNLLL